MLCSLILHCSDSNRQDQDVPCFEIVIHQKDLDKVLLDEAQKQQQVEEMQQKARLRREKSRSSTVDFATHGRREDV